MTTTPNVSNTIDDEFRWETLLTRIKKSSILVERLQSNTNPMLNFGLEKVLIDYMKTLSKEEQTKIEFESLVFANVAPNGVDVQDLQKIKHELVMESSSPQEQFEYAYSLPTLVENQQAEKIKWLTKAAEKQHRNAQTCLATIYDRKQDYKQAVFWFTKAAALGCNIAKNDLAACYRGGFGVLKDEKKAFQLYQEAANENDHLAQNNLGRCYECGYGVAADVNQAFKWYTRASEDKSCAPAFVSLGRCFLNGIGVIRDVSKAFRWFDLGVSRNDDIAFAYLGYMYASGIAVGQNLTKAAELYKCSADRGNLDGAKSLGICYLRGQGVTKNLDLAFHYFLLATHEDHELAMSFMKQ